MAEPRAPRPGLRSERDFGKRPRRLETGSRLRPPGPGRGGVRDRPLGGRFCPAGTGGTQRPPGTPQDRGRSAEPPPRRRPEEAGRAVTAVRAAAAASPPLPLRGSHRRGRGAAAAPTRVVDVQLVRDALVAPTKDDHQLPDGHGPVSVPGAGDGPGEGGNPPPVEEAGSRHLPNPRPSAHNSPRRLRRLRSRGWAGTRPQLCARGGWRGECHMTAGGLGEAGGLRGAAGSWPGSPAPTPGDVAARAPVAPLLW